MHCIFQKILVFFSLVALVSFVGGCPKRIPQPEIDAAESAMADIESFKDCAPETYQAAKTMMDRAKALLKEERYEEAKTSFLAAKNLAEKAREECEKKRKEQELKDRQSQTEPVAREVESTKVSSGPDNLVTVYFGFNDSSLSDEARDALGKDVEYLRNHSGLRVQIEGHCDNRGSTEYNLALGERRAMSVKSYLVKLGIEPARLEIISYGEERPADYGNSEDAFAKNRRAEFSELKPND